MEKKAKTVAILGGQWGDEGKGKIVDWAAGYFSVCARATGGNNAGHTVYLKEGKHVFHLIPSAITWEKVDCLLGNGLVIDPFVLLQEIKVLNEKGYTTNNLFISGQAHVILLYHKVMDLSLEKAKGTGKIGTTGRGIGPTYADKMHRQGIRINDLLDKKVLYEKIIQNLIDKKSSFDTDNFTSKLLEVIPADHFFDFLRQEIQSLGNKPSLSETAQLLTELYFSAGKKIFLYVADIHQKLDAAQVLGKNILLEGAQGLLLDIDQGTYPFVTSSNSSLGGLNTGLGISHIDEVYSIFKAYTTRVGSGPFPTEINDETVQYLREKGQEFGSTTGRPRRCGWFDAVITRYASGINGPKAIITKLDILSGLKTIKICNSYRYLGPKRLFNGEIYFKGKIIRDFPADSTILEYCVPEEWLEIPGWESDISSAKSWDELPLAAQNYLHKLEEKGKINISLISVGPLRDQVIIIPPYWSIVEQKYKSIIFDLDNTLIATDKFVRDLIIQTAELLSPELSLHIPTIFEIQEVQKKNLPFEEIFTEIFPNNPYYHGEKDLAQIVLEKYREQAKTLSYSATFGGFLVVQRCIQAGIIPVIVTNRVKMAAERLQQAGYPPFEAIFAPEKEEDRKPNLKAFTPALAFLKQKGINPTEILTIGDHPHDYVSARDAGIDFIAVLTGLTSREEFLRMGVSNEKIINNLSELNIK